MAYNGTMRSHGKKVGYIVLYSTRVGSLCHGYNDPHNRVLLGGNPVTLFTTRRKAQRAIRETVRDDPGRTESFQILRVSRCFDE